MLQFSYIASRKLRFFYWVYMAATLSFGMIIMVIKYFVCHITISDSSWDICTLMSTLLLKNYKEILDLRNYRVLNPQNRIQNHFSMAHFPFFLMRIFVAIVPLYNYTKLEGPLQRKNWYILKGDFLGFWELYSKSIRWVLRRKKCS